MEQQSTLTPEQSFSLRCHRDSFTRYTEKAIANANIEGRSVNVDDFHGLINAVMAALTQATEKENQYKELIRKDWGL